MLEKEVRFLPQSGAACGGIYVDHERKALYDLRPAWTRRVPCGDGPSTEEREKIMICETDGCRGPTQPGREICAGCIRAGLVQQEETKKEKPKRDDKAEAWRYKRPTDVVHEERDRKIIEALSEDPQPTTYDLADRFGMTRGAVSGAISRWRKRYGRIDLPKVVRNRDVTGRFNFGNRVSVKERVTN